MIGKGIKIVDQAWQRGKKWKWDRIKQKGWEYSDFLTLRSVIDAIPTDWKNKLNQDQYTTNTISSVRTLTLNATPTILSKISSKMLYWEFISKKFVKPSSQRYLSKKLVLSDIQWERIYDRIYESTIDVNLRMFQDKILNNCLYLNQKLQSFKLVDSAKCSFCFNESETIEHLFVDCLETRNFYFKCKSWLKQNEISNFPELNFKNILLGSDSGIMENMLLLLFKRLLYVARNKFKVPTLKEFQHQLILQEKIEYIIAESKSKIFKHLKKYEKINA